MGGYDENPEMFLLYIPDNATVRRSSRLRAERLGEASFAFAYVVNCSMKKRRVRVVTFAFTSKDVFTVK